MDLEMIKMFFPVLLGSFIGYCTNWIAIKMLFHPRKAIKIGKTRLPFTPGVIPKNQGRIARAVGETVNRDLFSEKDIAKGLKGSSAGKQIAEKITSAVFNGGIYLKNISGEKNLEKINGKLSVFIADEVAGAVQNADLVPVFRELGAEGLGNVLNNPMIAMFLGADMLDGIYAKLDVSVKNYVKTHKSDIAQRFIKPKISELTAKSTDEILNSAGVGRDDFARIAESLAGSVMDYISANIAGAVDVQKTVEDKINAMKVEELEKLVMSVMKNELQAVINLGALIGAVLGIVSIFIA